VIFLCSQVLLPRNEVLSEGRKCIVILSVKVQFMLAEPGSLVAHAVNMREYSKRTSDVQGDERALTSDEGMGLVL
jgi:hypothetical protein